MKLGAFVPALTATVALLGASDARAAVFTVNDVGDGSDVGLADMPNQCDASPSAGLQCTLRAAVEEANATAGADAINFAILGDGVHTVSPATGYPPLTDLVTIDGYTQPGASPNTRPLGKPLDTVLRIEIDGIGLPSNSHVFRVESGASGSTIKGFAIGNGTSSSAIFGGSGAAVQVQGNFLGTNVRGTSARPNGNGFFGFGGSGSTIGGSDPADRNLISGNQRGIGANGNVFVEGNYIGTQADGRSPLGNGNPADPFSRIVGLFSTVAPNTVIRNVIAHNEQPAVTMFNNGPGTPISQNRIFGNTGIGIDLNGDGVTPNDAGDGDGGPNGLQNFPTLRSAKTNTNTTKVNGVLTSTSSASFRIEIFSNKVKDREGAKFLGDLDVTTDAQGDASFKFKPEKRVKGKRWITATATALASGPLGATSEFSKPRRLRPTE